MATDSSRLALQAIPTGDRRHTAKIREGAQSSEVFCKDNNRRHELGLPPIPDPSDFDENGNPKSF